MPQPPLSAYLIGGDTLLTECGDVLLRKGHSVLGVITTDPRIRQWAKARDIEWLDASGDYRSRLAEESFDYLFAITHLALLPDDVLAIPRRGAINFHDGPLPRYAGLNTPVWALMHREPRYGVTWHAIDSGVDTGDVLEQSFFDVAAGETALSLNTKCMAAALESFPQLVDDLAAGTETRVPQERDERTYFGKFARPPAACGIDWYAPSDDVEAFVRALSFGPYHNPVGLPKSARADDGSRPFVIDAVRAVEGVGGTPGSILAAGGEGVVVATGDGAVTITAARALDGAELGPEQLAERFGLAIGASLLGIDSELGEVLTGFDRAMSRNEEFWVRRIRGLDPSELALARPGSSSEPDWRTVEVSVPAGLRSRFGEDAVSAVLAALSVYLARTGRKERYHLGFGDVRSGARDARLSGWYAERVPLEVHLPPDQTGAEVVAAMALELAQLRERGTYLRDAALREPGGRGDPLPIGVDVGPDSRTVGSVCTLHVSEDGGSASFSFDADRLTEAAATAIAASLQTCMGSLAAEADAPWIDLELVPEADRALLLEHWNATAAEVPVEATVPELFERQVDRTPEAVAVVFERESLTYRELDERANQLARHLCELGVEPGSLVGVHVRRSLDLMVAVLGIEKAGGAYLPLDPDFPSDRIAMMVDDSLATVLLTESALVDALPAHSARAVVLDSEWPTIAAQGVHRTGIRPQPDSLAYAIYTSGSTGTPKGVLVEHRNVTNFFTGMDAVIAHDPPGVWLAVTSLSFDISVLELLWTLARGFKVVIHDDRTATEASQVRTRSPELDERGMAFGLFMWGNDAGPGPSKYELMLEGARFFDQNGFDSVWTPERHFHAFGGPFPNPSVTGAAIAAVTERVSVRSGSCVSPLHHPVRIAEEWSVVDNLSNGRVGLSFAAGWQPNDFVLRPESYPNQKKVMLEQIDIVRRLWRGEGVDFENPLGETVRIRTLPRPVQEELPFWVTTAGNPDSYRKAGELGANVLTHLLGQSIDEVGQKIAIYRQAREEAGHDPDAGIVTLMLHTFVGDDNETVRELVRQPMKDYLGASMKLVLGFAWSFPAFKRPGGPDATPQDVDLSSLSEEELDAILDFAFDRYYETSGLFGDVETCGAMVDRCKAVGVDEIACLVDFGVDTGLVMESLPLLKAVRDDANRPPDRSQPDAPRTPFHVQVDAHRITHLQCTPSMAVMLMAQSEARHALGRVQHMLIGGEAFPPALAQELQGVTEATLTNMYGPTETTVWSSTYRLESRDEDVISIGRPIANTTMYVLDRHRRLLPVGVAGDLYIGGAGVTRGYHDRPDVTAERFIPDPFGEDGARMYWTGDLARWSSDGTLEFLGRVDHQVKVRGYRIELGEIEAKLGLHPGVAATAVVLRDVQAGDQRLVAYVVPEREMPQESDLKAFVRSGLPEYMVPAHVVELDRMPLTPNGKIDRARLPDVDPTTHPPVEYVEPENEIERTIAAAWCATLGAERVGVEDNFFDIGGHSLLVVQLHRRLSGLISEPVSLVDLYRFPTIRSLTDHLAKTGDEDLRQSADRAQQRRAVMERRRRGPRHRA